MHPLDLPRSDELDDGRWGIATLLVANLIPLFGVLLLGWRAFDVVFLYWLENVVIGGVNLLKILTCDPDPVAVEERRETSLSHFTEQQREELRKAAEQFGKGLAAKTFFVPFFFVHYGLFCFVHGVFVCVLMNERGPLGVGMNPFATAISALTSPWLLLAAAALTTSHLVSYFSNYLGRGEYREVTPADLMAAPYGRIVVLHIAIVLSGFLVMTLGSPVWLLLLLVVGKTWYELKLRRREHERGASSEALGAG